MKDYILIYLYEEDTPPWIEKNLSKEEVDKKIKKYNLLEGEYIIIQGKVIKGNFE